jgi:hypothetical protein
VGPSTGAASKGLRKLRFAEVLEHPRQAAGSLAIMQDLCHRRRRHKFRETQAEVRGRGGLSGGYCRNFGRQPFLSAIVISNIDDHSVFGEDASVQVCLAGLSQHQVMHVRQHDAAGVETVKIGGEGLIVHVHGQL